ncbi:Transcription factor Iwr1 [Phytophthora cinnamomi]|uniref:Transcription factor Iwr1 n=1 Tax=Phytophthora cinnamomi TaxID=4785 RepID=UPI00355AB11B|nr:Transcription factor Iwr1 [Phytophthora cinnamomi]
MVDEKASTSATPSGSVSVSVSASARAAPSAAAARASRTSKSKAEGSNEKPASFVFLRLKRKRTDDPMECLVVHSEPDAKRSRGQSADLLQAFTKLSTAEKRFVFKHIDTMEELLAPGRAKWTERLKRKARSLKDERADMLARRQIAPVFQKDPTASKQTERRVKQQQSRLKARRSEDVLKSRGLQPVVEIKEKQTMELHGIRLVDLQVSAVPDKEEKEKQEEREWDGASEKSKADLVTVNGARLKPTRVLNPHERELDEAIWNAFRADDFAPFFQIYHGRRPELRVDPVAFQRPADGSTILMAAALHGRSDVIEVLLRSGTASVLQRDWEGATAAVFAKRGGHANVETALLACEEAEQEKDYVYDVYCVDISASEQQDRAHDTATTSEGASEQASVSGVPVVSVSSEVHRWLSEEPSDEVEEYMLESDIDSNEEVDGLSEDSNDEDHVANDYPDEESSDESLADSEDLDEIGARRRWLNTEDDYTERDDFDY